MVSTPPGWEFLTQPQPPQPSPADLHGPALTVDADAAFDAIAEAVRMAQQWHKRGDAQMASAMANLIGLMLASVCGRREDEDV